MKLGLSLMRGRKKRGGAPTPSLAAPILTWTGVATNPLPPFDIDYVAEPAINDVVTMHRSTNGFASYDTASYTLLSITPPTTGAFDFGGNWPDGTYDTRIFVTRGAAQSSYSNIEAVTIEVVDAMAPTLTSPANAATGQTTGSGSVSTNEANGTLYFVVTESATSPSAAQVKAGQNHAGAAAVDAGSQAVSTTGSQSITGGFTGLTAGTAYYAHYMHEDAATNQSGVASATSFTTDAASNVITGAFVSSSTDGATSGTSKTFAAQDIGTAATYRTVIVAAAALQSSGNLTLNAVTIAGISATQIVGVGGGTARNIGLWAAEVPTGTTADIVLTTSANGNRWAISVYTVTGTTGFATAVAGTTFNNDAANAGPVDVTSPTDGYAICGSVAGGNPYAADGGNVEDVDAVIGATAIRQYAAHIAAAGAVSFACNAGDGVFYRSAAAAWGP